MTSLVESEARAAAPAPAPPTPGPRRLLPTLRTSGWVLLAVVGLAAVLRVPGLLDGLPAIHPDEGTVTGRAIGPFAGVVMPDNFDWPPGSSFLLTAFVAAVKGLGFSVPLDDVSFVRVGRPFFVGIALVTVAAAGIGAALVAERRGTLAALAGSLLVALSFTSVRLSPSVHPEHLQALLVLAAVLVCRHCDGPRARRALLGAALLGGLAGAVKYLGITVVGLPVALALVRRRDPATAGAAVLVGLAGFVLGTAGTVVRGTAFLDGFLWQVAHQSDGHLGYDMQGPGWVFQLITALPGNWGWVPTVAAVAAVAWFIGSRDVWRRWTGLYTLGLFIVVGLSRVSFPHYVLILVPLLAMQAGVFAVEVGPRLFPRRAQAAALAGLSVLMVGLVPTALDLVRLERAAGAPSTTDVAEDVAGGLPRPLWSEAYTGVAQPDEVLFSVSDRPEEVLSCACTVALSSSQEERYRAQPEKYADEIRVYDRVRAEGRVLAVVRPDVAVSHRWAFLPQWGLRRVPLTGSIPRLGPTVTFLDLRDA